jgi:hypothetical protein
MKPRIAAELLYEYEATLRMVDNVLDELRIADAESLRVVPVLRALPPGGRQAPEPAVQVPPDFCVRGYWQVQELVEQVREARQVMEGGPDWNNPDDPEGEYQELLRFIDRAVALVDRIEGVDGSTSAQREEAPGELRRELLNLLDRTARRHSFQDRRGSAALLLSEAETGLTRLGYLFQGEGADL